MKQEKKNFFRWFGGAFEPVVDFYALLNVQADKTLEGMQALNTWLKENQGERCQQVRDLEKEADEMKLDIQKKLVSSFVTPFDREDIYELSMSLDEVINSAKSVVREIDAMGVSVEDTQLIAMSEMLIEGTVCLHKSILNLKTNLEEASKEALLSRKIDSRFAKIYRQAMNELLEQDDFKKILRVKEVYKAMLLGAERIDLVGEKLLYAIVKMS